MMKMKGICVKDWSGSQLQAFLHFLKHNSSKQQFQKMFHANLTTGKIRPKYFLSKLASEEH